MIALLSEIWAIVVALWSTGNRLARAAIVIIAGWPIVLVLAALTGAPLLVSLLSLLPVAAVVLALAAAVDPLVVAVIAAFAAGRQALRGIATLIGLQLVIGVYFSVVPVANDRALVPLLVLVALAILFLSIGTQGRLVKTAITFLVIIAIILTVVFFAGGREEVRRHVEAEKRAAYPTAYELGIGTHAVPIPPGQWSGWVSATRGTSTYSLKCPADCEVVGWDGSRLFIKSGKFYPGQSPAMPIKISGQGPAIITIS